MIRFTTKQVMAFFNALNVVEKQINLDSTEVSPGKAFKLNRVDPIDGDFGDPSNQIDEQKFSECAQWLRLVLDLAPEEIQIENTNKAQYLTASDPQRIVDFVVSHQKNSECIEQPESYPKLAFFTMDPYNCTNLSAKGIAVLQDDYEQTKDNGYRNDTFIGKSNHLVKFFSLLANADDGVKINIIVRLGETHWVPVHCVKEKGHVHIIAMDSQGLKADYGQIPFIYEISQSRLENSKTSLYRTCNVRQDAPNNCGLFAIKDARKMEKAHDLLKEIQPYTVNNKKVSGISYTTYITPPSYENTVQFRRDHNAYIAKANALGIKLAVDQLQAASFDRVRSLEGSEIVTGKSEKNLTIHYFKDKYIKRVSKIIDQTSNLEDLKQRVDKHSLATLTLDRLNQTKCNR